MTLTQTEREIALALGKYPECIDQLQEIATAETEAHDPREIPTAGELSERPWESRLRAVAMLRVIFQEE